MTARDNSLDIPVHSELQLRFWTKASKLPPSRQEA
jgi:hypothetical protein